MNAKAAARSGPTTLALALTFVLLAPVARVLFPRLYVMGEDASYVAVGLLGVLVFAAPALAIVLVSSSPRATTFVGLTLAAAARLGVQFVHPIPAWLAFTATAAALVGATAALVGLSDRRSLRVLPYALIAGLALDTAARAPTGSWELVWQAGATPAATTVATVALIAFALAAAMRGPSDPDPGIPAPALAAAGPYLMLQFLFLQNLGFVGSQVGVSFPAALVVVLLGDGAALGAVAGSGALGQEVREGAGLVCGLIAVGLAAVLPRTEGVTAGACVILLQGATTGCLALATARSVAARGGRLVVAATLAGLGFLVFALLWQIHITVPLPFPRTVVPAAAASWLAITAFLSVRSRGAEAGTVPRLPTVLAAVSVAIALVVCLMTVAFSWPGAPVVTAVGDEVRLVTFNVRGATGIDAMVDVDAIADAIGASDPDVVILQEVARGWPVFGAVDMLARLRQRSAMPFIFEPAADAQFGNAVLSRLPMTRVAGGLLPDVAGKQRRSFSLVRIETAAGPLLVADAHLESDASAQVEALLVAVRGRPAIVAGDLNMETTDTANVQRFVAAGLVDAEGATGDPCRTTSAEPTSRCDRPDWVWVSRDMGIASFAIGPPSASDHLPVRVTVTMPN